MDGKFAILPSLKVEVYDLSNPVDPYYVTYTKLAVRGEFLVWGFVVHHNIGIKSV